MKKYILISSMFLLAAACSDKESPIMEVIDNVEFTASITTTRTSLSSGATSWNSGDRIGIFSREASAALGVSESENIPYYATSSSATSGFSKVGESVKASDVYLAKYPYSSSDTDYRAVAVEAPYLQKFVVNGSTGLSVPEVFPPLVGSGLAEDAIGGIVPLTFTPILPVLEFGFTGSGNLEGVEVELLGDLVERAGCRFMSGSASVDLSSLSLTADEPGENASKVKISFVTDEDAPTVATLSATPLRVQLLVGRFTASEGLKLTFTYSGGEQVSKTVWSGKTISMYNSVESQNRHIYQEISVPAKPFMPDISRPIYLFGDLNGWNEGNPATMYPMFKDNMNADNYEYKYLGYLPRGSFKFIPEVKVGTGTYAAYCNDEVNGKLVFDQTGLGVAFWNETAGFKNITINVQDLSYSISDYDASSDVTWTTIGVIGTVNGWGDDWDMNVISAENNHIWVLDNASVPAGDGYNCVKFRAENDWAYAWQNIVGQEWGTPFGKMVTSGPDCNIYFGPEAGTFKFIFNDISCHYWVLRK